MKRSLLAVLCFALSTVCTAGQLVAAPHYGTPWKLKQPEGQLVDVLVWGDEYYQVVESPDGYTLIRDPNTQVIVYANLTPDGNTFVSTGVRVGTQNPASIGVQPHLRINPDVRDAEARAARDRAFPKRDANLTVGGPVQAPPSTGNVVGLVLLADFDDIPATISQTEVENFCNQDGYSNNGNNGSVQNYFEDVSNGALNYTCYVNPYHRAAGGDFATYYDDCAQPWLSRAIELIIEILDEMEADGFDFSQYDANSDGEIDAINLFFAGDGTTCGWAKGMWPGAGGMGGAGWSADGKLANRFQITNMGDFVTLGTFCHENGHMTCGWPDLYDYDGDSAGVGGFDIMCNGMSNTNPVEPSAELKRSAGWETITDLTTAGTGFNLPNADGNTCYRWDKSATEYYLIENRQKTGRDAALPDAGLALWHIDTAGNNSNQQMTPGSHYYVTLVQADGDWELEGNVNQGDTFDLYNAGGSGNVRAATPCTDPNTDWWDGTQSDLSITNISTSQATMTFDFSPNDDDPVALVQNVAKDANTSCCINVTVADINNGSNDPDGPGDIASLCITHVDGAPVGCQQQVTVCGDGNHTVRLTVTDLCGNTDFADATVEVINEPPVAVSQDFAANADDACCITVTRDDIDAGTYDPDGAGDIKSFCITHVDGVPIGCEQQVTVCDQGMHTVTITVTDWCDFSSSSTANVEVIDITPPDIAVSLDREFLWPPNHKMVEVCAAIVATDNCDADPEIDLVSITSDEPENDKGDGNTGPDIQNADYGTEDPCFSLRSERQGGGDGRDYTITYSATDNVGNVGYAVVHVYVDHDQSSNAMASSGFGDDGTELQGGIATFALVIPGSEEIDVSTIDAGKIYVGNTRGVVRATDTRKVDVDKDGRLDLAALFEQLDPEQLAVAEVPQATAEVDGSFDAQLATDGPIGLHYVANGVSYLVTNIYALGEPVELPTIISIDLPEPDVPLKAELPEAASPNKLSTKLSSVHPNPFNPETTVDFSLATATLVRIAIYDVKGSLVRRLVDESMPAGGHQARWNGRDDAGRTASSGIYFVRMIAGSYTEVRKIVMLK